MIYDLMAARRSVRRFHPEPLDRALVERLLRAATRAPSASNQQPWRFLAVSHRPKLAALAAAVRAAVAEIADASAPEYADVLRRYGAYFGAFEGAPLVVAFLWRPLRLLSELTGDRLADGRRAAVAALEERSALVSVSLALGHLLLAAQAEGLGACCMTGPLLVEDEVRAVLRVPPSWRVAAFVALGHAAEAPPATPRKPLERVLTWIDEEEKTHEP